MTEEKKYWRSLEQRVGAPGVRDWLEREFPEGASELPEGVTRRQMLGLLGASLSLAGLAGCRRPVEEIVPYVSAPEAIVPGQSRRFATTMPTGLGAMGLLVTSREGRPIKIEGNELHPYSLGASSHWAQAEMLELYDPDRAKGIRLGQEAKTWDDFVKSWGEIATEHAADGGAGLAILSEPFSSPTLARLKRELEARYPRARWATWQAVSDENVHRGVEQVSGAALLPVYRFDLAKVVLALDADFLLTESDAVRHAADFAASRRVRKPGDTMSRLYAAEGVLSLAGANADHRLACRTSKIGALVAALARRVAGQGGAAPEGVPERWLDAVAHDLTANRGASLVVAGRRQPPAVHAAVLALNAALGNVGTTVSYREPVDAALPDTRSLVELVTAMRGGIVQTLVVLAGNPGYDAPADLEWGAALGQVKRVIRLGAHEDESAPVAGWLIPEAHFLESWADARATDGTLSVLQPLILPLYGGKSAVDLLGLLASGQDAQAFDRVRETWSKILPAATFERAWFDLLRDGLLKDSAVQASALTARAAVASPEAWGGGSIEVVLAASPALLDGRYANNAWLQELPDSLTKITWDNAALMSPATAKGLGVTGSELVRVQSGPREIVLPAWILPGMAEGTVAIGLGYGRTKAGRIGNGVGVDAYPLRASTALDLVAAEVAVAGEAHPIAQTQDHGTMEDRPIVREATLERFAEEPNFAQEAVEVPVNRSMWSDRTYDSSPQWGMSIDLTSCTGCNACLVACQAENNVPVVGRAQVLKGREMHWIRLDRYFTGDPEGDVEVVFQPMPCMQCENAPCEQVCPVAATVHDAEGLNVMVYNRCIGTRYCSNNCPYKVRRFNFFNYTKDTPEILKLAQNPEVTVRSRGVMEKCTYCTQRIEAGKIAAKLAGRPLADGDVVPACAQACPTRAITFGDIRDAGSQVSQRKAEPRNYTLLEDLFTRPRTSFLAKLRNPNPALEDPPA
jgi:molybdopterin-containing oxidoreductase family iron-sulfur binding subunit